MLSNLSAVDDYDKKVRIIKRIYKQGLFSVIKIEFLGYAKEMSLFPNH